MRDPDRLEGFYEEIKAIHRGTFPDWRFGQLMYNFLGWLYQDKHIDCFFPEEDQMVEYFKEFAQMTEGGS